VSPCCLISDQGSSFYAFRDLKNIKLNVKKDFIL
jgi:hypothetical protein